jgi:hypothetical protein
MHVHRCMHSLTAAAQLVRMMVNIYSFDLLQLWRQNVHHDHYPFMSEPGPETRLQGLPGTPTAPGDHNTAPTRYTTRPRMSACPTAAPMPLFIQTLLYPMPGWSRAMRVPVTATAARPTKRRSAVRSCGAAWRGSVLSYHPLLQGGVAGL